jgi:hypothetical protein
VYISLLSWTGKAEKNGSTLSMTRKTTIRAMTNIQSLRYDKKRCFLRVDIEVKGIMHKRHEQTEMRGEEKLIWILGSF